MGRVKQQRVHSHRARTRRRAALSGGAWMTERSVARRHPELKNGIRKREFNFKRSQWQDILDKSKMNREANKALRMANRERRAALKRLFTPQKHD